MLTYATSSTFGILIREINAPIALVALRLTSSRDAPLDVTDDFVIGMILLTWKSCDPFLHTTDIFSHVGVRIRLDSR